MRADGRNFRHLIKASLAGLATLVALASQPSSAQGDLLIAPTRVVLDGRRGAEVILANMGNEDATYRISLELRRMDENGNLEAVEENFATEAEKAALEMIRFAPRRVTLPPDQPQSVRISARPGAELPDGEYRVHMSFAALPKVQAVATAPTDDSGISIALTPIYGIVMPIIVRKGELQVTAALANPRLVQTEQGHAFAVDMTRNGQSSVYGDLMIFARGASEPAFVVRGIGVYPEVELRHVMFGLSPEQVSALKGAVRVEFREASENGGGLIAAADAVFG